MQTFQFFGALFLFLSVQICTSSYGASIRAYNEVMTEAGAIRPAFEEFIRHSKTHPYPVDPQVMQSLMGNPLGDSIKILPIPLVLPTSDYEILQAGAQQRVRALTAFFADVIFHGSATVRGHNVLSLEQVQQLFLSDGPQNDFNYIRSLWSERTPADIHFIYGPDIVRNPLGQFMVIEDNIGPIGGLGDIAATHEAFSRAHNQKLSLKPPLLAAIDVFLADIPQNQRKDKVLVLYREDGTSKEESDSEITPKDHEDKRIAAALKKMGLQIWTTSSLKDSPEKRTKIVSGHFSKIVNLSGPDHLGLEWPDQLKFDRAFKQKKFELFFSPSVEVLSSKALLPFVEEFIRIYLGEEPILKTQPTRWITDANEIMTLQNSVVKKSDGIQGSEVYILNTLTEKGRRNLVSNIHSWDAWDEIKRNHKVPRFVLQELVETSYIPAELPDSWVRFNVDFRPHVFVVRGDPLIPAIWGRANFKFPGFLNNVSRNAMELVITTETQCERLLMQR